MKLLRCLLPLVMATCGLSTTAHADCCRGANDTTPVLLRQFINSKRNICQEEKDSHTSISGDIRTIFGYSNEHFANDIDPKPSTRCDPKRAPGTPCNLITKNDFEVIFDLYFDYSCDRSWAVAWLEFENPAGIERTNKACTDALKEITWGSGTCDGLCLRKAYLGYNIIADGCTRIDIEVGRRPLYTIFDSYVQFRNRFDGILLRYARKFEVGDFYINSGAFIVDENVLHFGVVSEMGLLNIADSGWDAKYSVIGWRYNGRNRCGTEKPAGARFLISQFTLQYTYYPNWLPECTPLSTFGAFLVNSEASKSRRTKRRRENLAWYLGMTVGQVCSEGDWALQLLYIACQAQAVPSSDVYYIGTGNALCEIFESGIDPNKARGNTNFQGGRIELLYAFTTNLLFDTMFEFSVPETRSIGGSPRGYRRFQVEGIYAF